MRLARLRSRRLDARCGEDLPTEVGVQNAAAAEALFTSGPMRMSQAPAVLGHHQARQFVREPRHRSVACVGQHDNHNTLAGKQAEHGRYAWHASRVRDMAEAEVVL